jgi:hypothetical protein
LPSWIRIRNLYADPDPAAQIYADPCGSGSETLESTRYMSLISAIYQHYAWPDPISWDGTFKLDSCIKFPKFKRLNQIIHKVPVTEKQKFAEKRFLGESSPVLAPDWISILDEPQLFWLHDYIEHFGNTTELCHRRIIPEKFAAFSLFPIILLSCRAEESQTLIT